jgi:hypothetical protein
LQARTPHLEEAVLRTVGYADVFDYPLTAGEVHRYLIGVRARRSEVEEALAESGLVPDRLTHRDGLFSLRGREEIMELRRLRRAPAERLWPWAVRYGRRIAAVPFVRMVAVTGSLAANNVDSEADVDYFIVTEPGRVWMCRAFVVCVVRAAARRGIVLCPNFILSGSAIELRQRDLYTAWELAQMVPIAGLDTYRRLRERNEWAEAFLPNAEGVPWEPEPLRAAGPGAPRGRLVRTVEGLLRSRAGDRLEKWERTRKVRRFTREAAGAGGAPGEAEFSADWCKGHLGTHRAEVMARYRRRHEDPVV